MSLIKVWNVADAFVRPNGSNKLIETTSSAKHCLGNVLLLDANMVVAGEKVNLVALWRLRKRSSMRKMGYLFLMVILLLVR